MAKFRDISIGTRMSSAISNASNLVLEEVHEALTDRARRCQAVLVNDERERSEAAEPASEVTTTPTETKDVVMLHSQHDDGQGYNVLRVRDGSLEVGAIRNIREGAPIHGDVVSLTQRKENERLYNVETLVKASPPPAAPRHGPAQVAIDKYRTNWEHIFGKPSSSSGNDAPN